MSKTNEFIKKVLEDIALAGANTGCIVYLDKESMLISDYSLEEEKVIYMDEARARMPLFQLLVTLISFDYAEKNHPLPIYAIIIKAMRNIKLLSQVKFAEFLGVPRRTLEDWESGARRLSFEKLIDVGKRCGIDPDTVFAAIKREL